MKRTDVAVEIDVARGPRAEGAEADGWLEIEVDGGLRPDAGGVFVPLHGAEAGRQSEIESSGGLRPFQIDKIARVIAAKAFLGDLLREMKRAEVLDASDRHPGTLEDGGRAESGSEIEFSAGPSAILAMLCATYEDIQKARLAAQQRGLVDLGDALKLIEDRTGRQVKKELMAQPVWPWLSQFPGLGGVHVARLVAIIGDPRRFPGQKCSEGHTVAPDHDPGAPCPIEDCTGTMLVPRTTTGTRALWHYAGLHVVDGNMPKRRKGQRADWSPTARTAVLMPGGIAEQIVRSRVLAYRDIYDATKARLTNERAAGEAGSEKSLGPQDDEGEAGRSAEIDTYTGLALVGTVA